ncbi:hypothetical protein SCB49_14140 [unidentified eubacterium SCB49]|nr:hypothetical protein SCB49_14140 [unidentified eubacterium SCB49]
MSCVDPKIELDQNGYAVLPNFYSETEIENILDCIDNTEQNGEAFLKTKDLFAIRQLLINIPELEPLVFNSKLLSLISNLFKNNCYLTKGIYFDKTSQSNWFVPYHQDLSISVDQKIELDNYNNWTFKKGQYGVQPPLKILQDTITIRIHLDTTTKENGAIKVIPKSHTKGIIRTNSEDWCTQNEHICEVPKGGVMLMKPLTLHASNRTTNGEKRRVIHLEFNKHLLNAPLKWLEFKNIINNSA